MNNDPTNSVPAPLALGRRPWLARVIILAFLAVAIVVIWVSNTWLSERFTEATRNRASVRQALYSGTLVSELQRNSVVPLLLSRDPTLTRALENNDFSNTSQQLISFVDEIGAASIMLLNRDGRVVAATDRNRLGELRTQDQFFVQAQRQSDTAFTTNARQSNGYDFIFSRQIRSDNRFLGVIMVEVDLARIIERWRGTGEALFVTDSEGRIILATEPRWRGLTEAEAMEVSDPPSAIQRALDATGAWGFGDDGPYFLEDAMLRQETRIPFRGWRLVSFTAYSSVRERVNGVLALEIMGFALLLAGGFYWMSRRARRQSRAFQRESVELRRLNDRLQREIAERQRVEKNLEEAEQSLQQSQKLAALGEMSAAVSHELNQPLAAMKTYLAGAKLLLQRRRPDEALSSFQRIDDLIERMGAITRQLKSYARKGSQAFEPVDLRAALQSALTMMEPQLRTQTVHISQTLPRRPVMVLADRLRLEQVIINLLRNALDAMREEDERELDLLIAEGDEAILTVRDSGRGIEDLDALFEPFYTTKAPGDGVGLGLAISSGIVADLGGRLTARNGENRGAVFQLRLPIYGEGGSEAAE
ncbi:sensor histidine kinase [Rhodobacterales bacterium HKCCE2091]|nr:sensor histidine kinase [Rhodobacterales bacterium HKCCE2091]